MINKIFGRLKVLKDTGLRTYGKKIWLCRCECGKLTTVTTGGLNSGKSKSCGCLVSDLAKSNGLKSITHGHSRDGKTSPTYQSWRAMHQRCECPKNKDYHYYGGRGITVCKEWKDFSVFLKDMGERPSKDYSIDRDNPDKNYDPSNCVWLTKSENSKKGNIQRRRMRILKEKP